MGLTPDANSRFAVPAVWTHDWDESLSQLVYSLDSNGNRIFSPKRSELEFVHVIHTRLSISEWTGMANPISRNAPAGAAVAESALSPLYESSGADAVG